jgi:TfoX/Sxy family transcriptional regulator of competence genes
MPENFRQEIQYVSSITYVKMDRMFTGMIIFYPDTML